jgi:hypothetical protein
MENHRLIELAMDVYRDLFVAEHYLLVHGTELTSLLAWLIRLVMSSAALEK